MSDTSSKCNSCRIGYSTFKASCVYCRENPNNEPDAMHNYEPIEPSTITMIPPKRTRYDKLMADMTVEKMANARLIVDWREDDDGYIQYVWRADGNELLFTNYDDAMQAEIAWLNSEVDDAG